MKQHLLYATAAVLMAACASAPAPSYQAAADLNSSGYVTAPRDDGRYTVAYTGARGMSRAQVAEFAMLRAAELTLESGQEWFAVIETTTQNVQLLEQDDLKARTGGGFVGGESAGTGAGGAGSTPTPGASDAMTRGGPSTGGFGGGDVPYQVLERWTPPTVPQTVLVIQMGKGDEASFPGLAKAPEIFGAQVVADEIRGKMNK
ncbi:MAG: hypothetical protein GX535_13865 [Xanthomonadaceae bacterium]|nr:hypothetical protein [Xanthomonadaceae bacterium]